MVTHKTISRKPPATPPPPPPVPKAEPPAPPPAPAMVEFPGKGDIKLESARQYATPYGQFLRKPSPEICADGTTTPTCRADIAAMAAVMHMKDYADRGEESARTLAISSVDTLYSLAPSEETFLLMLVVRQQLGIDLVKLQRRITEKKADPSTTWGPDTFLTNDTLSLKSALRSVQTTDVKLSQTSWSLEKAVAQTLLDSHKGAIDDAIQRAHAGNPLDQYLQKARMAVLIGNRDEALALLEKAQAAINTRTNLTAAEQLSQVTLWHRQATLSASFSDQREFLKKAAALLDMQPKGSSQRISLKIENLALGAQLGEKEFRAGIKREITDSDIHHIRNLYHAAVAEAEEVLLESDGSGKRTIRFAPILELKATLAEQQLGIAFALSAVDGNLTRAARIRNEVEDQLKKDVLSYATLISAGELSAFKARHYWAMAQYDFFTGAIQSAVAHLQTIAMQHRGTSHETMLWAKDNWPFMTGIVAGDHTFSPKLNEKSLEAGLKTFMQAFMKQRGYAYASCESGALVFTLGTAVATRGFNPAMPLSGCFVGSAASAVATWSDASALIQQSYVTGLSSFTDSQMRDVTNTLLMNATVAVFSGVMGYMAQRMAIAITGPLQNTLLARNLVTSTPWLHHGVTIGFREASHVAGGLAMGTVSNNIYGVLGETQHQGPLVDHWATYSVLGWIGVFNPGSMLFGKTGFVTGMARAFTNISLSGLAMGVYTKARHPGDDTPFLEQTADTTAMLGVLHSTLSLSRMWRVGRAVPRPLDDLVVRGMDVDPNPVSSRPVVEANPLPVGRGVIGPDGFYHLDAMDPVAYRRSRRHSDRLLGVNARVRTHMDNFLGYVRTLAARDQTIAPESTAYYARQELTELLDLAERGLSVDVRELDVVWKIPEVPGVDMRIMSLKILDAQVQKGHIKRPSKGLLCYPGDARDFHLLGIFQVMQPNWSLTRTNITALNEAFNANPDNPMLKYVAIRTFHEVQQLSAEFANIKQHCSDTLRQTFSKHGIDPESGENVTPVPEFIMSAKEPGPKAQQRIAVDTPFEGVEKPN